MRQEIMATRPCGRGFSDHDKQEVERKKKELGTTYNHKSHTPSDLLPPARPHLVSNTPQSSTIIWGQEVNI
jgi:hypothetical protein